MPEARDRPAALEARLLGWTQVNAGQMESHAGFVKSLADMRILGKISQKPKTE